MKRIRSKETNVNPKWASVSEALSLFNCSSGRYIQFTMLSKYRMSVFKRSSEYLEVESNALTL